LEAERREAVKMEKVKCGICGKKHDYYIYVAEVKKRIASAVCKECEKYLNQNVTERVNKIVNKYSKGQSDILTLGFVGYLVLIVVVALCIF